MKRLFAFCLFLSLLQGCGGKAGDAEARVNGEAISAADLDLELRFSGSNSRETALEDLIDLALVLQEGGRLGVRLSAEALESALQLARAGTEPKAFQESLKARGLKPAEWRERVRKQALADEVVRLTLRSRVAISRQDLKDYYWEHVTRFRRKESGKLSQVFSKSRRQAEKAHEELRLGEPFAEVARRYSEAPEAAAGGSLGWVEKGSLPSVLDKAAFALKAKTHSQVLKSPYGWHLIYMEERREARNFSLDEAAPEIHSTLLREREQPLYRDWLFDLRGKAEILRRSKP